jgi:hypothetical protein
MKTFVLLLGFAISVQAQDLAPSNIANHAANYATVSANGGLPVFSTVMFTAGQSFRLSPSGSPLTDSMSFTWTKTGPATATLVESNSSRTLTTALTFTTSTSATFRSTSTASTVPQTGEIAFAPIPQPGPPLLNISTRATLSAGQSLTPGFVVGGTVPRRVLVRAVGPTLAMAPFNVPGVMGDPSLTVFQGSTPIASNNDWGGSSALIAVFAAVGAFPLPLSSLDGALLLTLAPGAYTAQVRGTGAGEVLVEIYFVD